MGAYFYLPPSRGINRELVSPLGEIYEPGWLTALQVAAYLVVRRHGLTIRRHTSCSWQGQASLILGSVQTSCMEVKCDRICQIDR